MLTAAGLRARCWARRRCSSTARCTAAATTRLPCWPRWPHEPPCSRLRRGGWWCPRWLEGGGEQVAGRKAAVGPPFLGDVEDLLLGGAVVELVSGLDGLSQRKVTGQHDVLPAEGDDERALHGPGTYPGNDRELRHDLVVGQAAQDIRVQPAVRHALGEVAECVGLPPR